MQKTLNPPLFLLGMGLGTSVYLCSRYSLILLVYYTIPYSLSLCVYVSVYLSLCLSLSPPPSLSIYIYSLSVSLSLSLSLSLCLSVSLSVSVSVSLCLCLSVSVSVSLSLYSIVPYRKFGSPYLSKATAAARAALFIPVCVRSISMCPNSGIHGCQHLGFLTCRCADSC